MSSFQTKKNDEKYKRKKKEKKEKKSEKRKKKKKSQKSVTHTEGKIRINGNYL